MLTALLPLAASTAAAPVGGTSNVLLYTVISSLGSAFLVFMGSVILRRYQRDQLIADASEKVVDSATKILERHEKDLAAAQGEIGQLRERIVVLESQLQQSKDDVARIDRERHEAILSLAFTQQRVKDLESEVKRLERMTPKRRSDTGRKPPAEN